MLNFEDFEIEDPMLDNYGSFIANLRGSVRAHTQSFIENDFKTLT